MSGAPEISASTSATFAGRPLSSTGNPSGDRPKDSDCSTTGSHKTWRCLMKPQRKLKVLHVGKFYPPHMGGIETHLQALCGELCKTSDVRVLVASEDRENREELCEGVPVSRVATLATLASAPLCPKMVTRIRRSGADIVHIHLPNPIAVLAYLASGHKGKLVITYHSDTVKQKVLGALFEPLLHAALKRA